MAPTGCAKCPRVGTEVEKQEVRKPMWVVIKIMVPFWVLRIIRHLVCRGPIRGP